MNPVKTLWATIVAYFKRTFETEVEPPDCYGDYPMNGADYAERDCCRCSHEGPCAYLHRLRRRGGP